MSREKKTVSRWLKLALMGLLLVALVLGVIFAVIRKQERELEESEESREFVLDVLYEYQEQDIYSISCEREDGTATIYSSVDSDNLVRWFQAEYPERSLNSIYADMVTIAERCSVYELIRENATQADLASFGLDRPFARLVITLRGGAQDVLLIGSLSLKGNYAYVMREGESTIYSTSYLFRKYSSYTTLDLYQIGIAQIPYSANFSFCELYQKGKPLVRLQAYDATENFEQNYNLNYSGICFASPYDFRRVIVATNLLEDVFSKDAKENIQGVGIIEISASPEALASYGLSETDPEYYIHMQMISGSPNAEGLYTVYENEYYFGYRFGDNNEYVYFRQNGDNMVYGVLAASLDQYDFDAFSYIWTNIFESRFIYVDTLDIYFNDDEHYFFDVTAFKDEANVDRFTVTMDGRELDSEDFAQLLSACFMLRADSELWTERPDCDESDSVRLLYHQNDGTVRDIVFYRMGDFSYVTEMQPGLWFVCHYFQFDSLHEQVQKLAKAD